MGDSRFARPYKAVKEAPDRAAALQSLTDQEVIEALAHASRERDPLFANLLATEASNRMARARIIFENMADGLLSVDGEGRITSINPAAAEMLRWPPSELIGKDRHETIHHQDEEGSPLAMKDCQMRSVLETGRVARSEEDALTRRDGTTFPVSFTAAPVSVEGEVGGIVIAFRDITERRQREQELARRVAELEATIHSVHDAIYIGDATGIHMANAVALEMLGFRTLAELQCGIAELSYRLNNRDPDTREKIPPEQEPFARALAGEEVVARILSTNLQTGEDVLLRCAAAPILLGGEVIGAVAVNTRIETP